MKLPPNLSARKSTNHIQFSIFAKKIMLPYGISDYKDVQVNGLYYIDKTHFIPLLERQPRYLFLIRPRRFGKSLLVSMLEAYYDLRYQHEFDRLFKDTYILEHPTKERNSYYVLRLDFSAVDSQSADANFNTYANQRLQNFIEKYGLDVTLDDANVNNNLNKLFDYCNLRELPLFILIDEYDNFINDMLVKDEQQYKKLVTGQEAVYKQFFKTLKAGTSGTDASVKKMFITGVSPLAMYDLTSGFNIGTNITTDEAFNDVLGVTEAEVLELIGHYSLQDQQETILERIRHWYDGYRFNEDVPYSIFNTDMILYYFNALVQYKKEPRELVDINVRSDYSKIRFLVQSDRKLNGNFSVLNELLSTSRVETPSIKSSFSAFEMRDRDHFVSLLFYLGLISIEEYEAGMVQLTIPNQTIRKIMAEFLQKTMEENDLLDIRLPAFNRLINELAFHRKLSVFDYLGERINESSSIRDYISGESFIKGFLTAYLSLNPYYEVNTEREFTKGFVDIYLHPITGDVPYGAAIELKYIKRNELTEALLEEKSAEATAQLQRYGAPPNTIKVALVFHGWELVKVPEVREG